MNSSFDIINTEIADLPIIHQLFDASIKYQETRGYPVWRNYDHRVLHRDIENKNQYKIVVNDDILMVFSATYSDPLIWRERDTGDSIYIHRIVVNPAFKGRKLFGRILEWSILHGKQMGRANIRMDTWADNPAIIEYYKNYGFVFIENYTTPNIEELPVHNRNLAMALLEYKLE